MSPPTEAIFEAFDRDDTQDLSNILKQHSGLFTPAPQSRSLPLDDTSIYRCTRKAGSLPASRR
ncbi:MAG: hypothetical protein CMI18_10740 [Opitutaceae bacterium]|nr:hypothetical protein [Opitutaceae bacterium]